MLARYRVRPFGGVEKLSCPWEGMPERLEFMNFGWRRTYGKEFLIRAKLLQNVLATLDEECLMHLKA